jgi:hypothetical protein
VKRKPNIDEVKNKHLGNRLYVCVSIKRNLFALSASSAIIRSNRRSTMTKNAFNHYEVYARRGAHKRHSKERRPSLFDIHAELTRAPGGCQHITNPEPPNILFGLNPDAVIEQAVSLAAQAVRLRIDSPLLLAGVMTWPVPRDAIENNEEEGQKYLAWREDAVAWAQRLWGDQLKCIAEHVDEGRLHLHYWVLPALRPDRRLSVSDVDFGRRAAKAVDDAGGSKREQRAASDQAMREFQEHYWIEVGCKHGLARLGPQRLRLTRQEWKDQEAERKRVAQAWHMLRSNHAELQLAANTSVAKRVAEALATAEAAVDAAKAAADERIAMIKSKAGDLIGQWRNHAAALNSTIENHKAAIVEKDRQLQSLEAMLREHGLSTGPAI